MNCSRRQHLKQLVAALACGAFGPSVAAAGKDRGNFRYIYSNESLRAEFKDFLVNVFHLYPEDDLHARIAERTAALADDEAIYRGLQQDLGDIKPVLGDLTYALPALIKQKQVMARQTSALLDGDRRYDGYLEIGSTGRYLDLLEEQVEIVGERYMVSPIPASYSIMDMVDRGQVFKAGKTIDLAGYETGMRGHISAGSLDLVTVYIGFHHCPLELRDDFFADIRDAMRPGGYLIVRDHDARDEKMQRVVALAHDVFNMGTRETWAFNEDELRHFYSLAALEEMLSKAGFKTDGRRLYQDGDPTLNALMVYRKV